MLPHEGERDPGGARRGAPEVVGQPPDLPRVRQRPMPRYPDKNDPVWNFPVVPIGSPTGRGGWFSDPIADPRLPDIEPVPLPAVPDDPGDLPPLVDSSLPQRI